MSAVNPVNTVSPVNTVQNPTRPPQAAGINPGTVPGFMPKEGHLESGRGPQSRWYPYGGLGRSDIHRSRDTRARRKEARQRHDDQAAVSVAANRSLKKFAKLEKTRGQSPSFCQFESCTSTTKQHVFRRKTRVWGRLWRLSGRLTRVQGSAQDDAAPAGMDMHG